MEIERETLPWREGWLLNPPAGTQPAETGSRPGFRLRANPGEIAPNIPHAAWLLRLEPPPKTGCLAHGFVCAGETGNVFHHVYCPAPGTLCGEADHAVEVRLVSDKHPTRRDGAQAILDAPGLCVILLVEKHAGGTRWALVWSGGGEHETLVQTKAALAVSAKNAWAELLAHRREIRARATCDRDFLPAMNEAIECLLGAMRPADGAFPGLWLDTENDSPAMNLGRALAVLPALGRIAPDDAEKLIQTILLLEEPDHSLPAFVAPNRSPGQRHAPPPLAAQAALALWRANPSLDFSRRIVPRLARLLRWQLDYFESQPQGICRWRHPAESLAPEIYDDRLATPDTSALLLAELDAFAELAAPFPDVEPIVAPVIARRKKIEIALQTFFWDAGECEFRSRYLDGRPIARPTVASAMPLLSAKLAPPQIAQILKLIGPGGVLRQQGAIANWAAWESDKTSASASPLVQILILRALRRRDLTEKADLLASGLAAQIRHEREQLGRLPAELSKAHSANRAPLETAALVIHLAFGDELGSRVARHRVSPLLNWLDKQRRGLATAATLLAAGIALALAAPALLHRDDETGAETGVGLAQMHADQGDWRGAISLYEQLLGTPLRDSRAIDFRLGNAWFHLDGWPQAEAAYRTAIARNPDQPRAWMNLALTLYQQQKFGEAATWYRNFIAKFGTYYPDLAARAQTALELCGAQKH